MPALQHRFTDLARLTEELHGLFDALTQHVADPAEEDALHRLHLAVHEWTANLVQHATFRARPPLVVLTLAPRSDGSLACTVEDTSDGFDLDTALAHAPARLGPFPERGMGLRILRASVRDLSYGTAPHGGHFLAFVVSRDDDTPFSDVL